VQMVKKPVSNPAAADATAFVKTCPNGHSVFQLATHVESRFMVQIPEGDQLDDICKPSYWAHHAARVTPKSLLTCIDQRLRWEADLRVLEAGRNYLRVAVVRHVEYDVKALAGRRSNACAACTLSNPMARTAGGLLTLTALSCLPD